jgi:hypothetical protein
MIGNEATGETERATTLDRFLSRSVLSALAEGQDIEWFKGRWMDFETEVTHLGRSPVHTFAWTVDTSRRSGKKQNGVVMITEGTHKDISGRTKTYTTEQDDDRLCRRVNRKHHSTISR